MRSVESLRECELFKGSHVELYEKLEEGTRIYSTAARSLASFAGIKELDVVVDAGCGTGISTSELVRRKNRLVIGVDKSADMLRCATAKIRKGATFICADRLLLDKILKRRVDAVFSSFTYYYFVQSEEVLRRFFTSACNVLKENGIFAFNVTSYLTPLAVGGKTYNEFAYCLYKATEEVLKD